MSHVDPDQAIVTTCVPDHLYRACGILHVTNVGERVPRYAVYVCAAEECHDKAVHDCIQATGEIPAYSPIVPTQRGLVAVEPDVLPPPVPLQTALARGLVRLIIFAASAFIVYLALHWLIADVILGM